MKYNADNSLYESITHQTDKAPYSLHYTEVPMTDAPALYLHWHDEMEFLYLSQGSLHFHVEDKIFLLHAGDGIFIPSGLLHYATTYGDEQPHFYAFVLSPEFIFPIFDSHRFSTYLAPILHNNLAFTTKLTPDEPWQKIILSYLKNIFESTENGELQIRGYALLIWHQIFHNHIRLSENINLPFRQSEQLSNIISYIQEHFASNLTLQEMAHLAHLSEGQFCRSFKSFTGMSPFQYLIRYRILKSCDALLLTNDKITDIAISSGFNNISYYNRSFIKIMHMTPGEYRKSARISEKQQL